MRKTAVLVLSLMLFSVLFVSCGKKEKKNQWAYVTVAKLFYRDKPSSKGKRKGSLALAEKVLVLETSSKKEKIGNKEDYWIKVESGAKKGWVYAAFLSDQPVLSPTAMAKKMTGLYYYSQKGKPNVVNRILDIKEGRYTEKIFSLNLGISDKYQGKVIYQADSLYLSPQKRWVRPAAHIVYPQGAKEQSAYSKAYRFFSNDENLLVNLKRYPANGKKYFILKCGKKTYLLDKKETSCQSLTWAYEKRK